MEKLKSLFSFRTEAQSLPIHRNPKPSLFQEQELGKAILNLAFSATIALVVIFFNKGSSITEEDSSLSLSFLAIAILIAFSASFVAISLSRSSFHRAARALEHIGIVATVVAFFMLMSFLLTWSLLKWFALIACVLSLLVYVAAHFVEGLSDGPIEEG